MTKRPATQGSSKLISRREALDGAARRRIYLFRHGAVDYVDSSGNIVDNPDDVSLSRKGREQAAAMHDLFEGVEIDRALCSGLRRTRETADRVLGERKLDVGTNAEFAEIRAAHGDRAEFDLLTDIAFSHWRATEDGSTFLGGETYADFYARISAAMEALMHDDSWHDLAIFAHGGTNAAVLGWTSGLGLSAFGTLDQATCCLNVLDFDFVPDTRQPVRKIVRAMNVTALDPAKHRRHASGMENLAMRLLKSRR